MNKYIPGPWRALNGQFVVANSGIQVANLPNVDAHSANLIAAAPQLLEALKEIGILIDAEILVRSNDQESVGERTLKAMAMLTAAIDKAEGRKS